MYGVVVEVEIDQSRADDADARDVIELMRLNWDRGLRPGAEPD
jgi:hypothetical protein